MGLNFVSVGEAISRIQSDHQVFVHGGAATPHFLLSELVQQAGRLKDVNLMHLHTEGPAPYAGPQFKDHFRVTNFFVGSNLRAHLDYKRVDYLPCFLSQIPKLFRTGVRQVDVALLHVSPPDRHGNMSLGVSVDVAKAAAEAAKIIIAQVNPRMPRVHGDSFIHESQVDFAVAMEADLPEAPAHAPSDDERAIARHIAGLVEDGATLQLGIGAIPAAVATELVHHRDLGVHSEMWTDSVVELLAAGAVTNGKKKVHAGKCVSSFIIGGRRTYEFIDDNPAVIQLGSDYVNDIYVIGRNPKVVAINSAVEVDLTGQVVADSIGHRIISGVGGQMDFMRGASLSRGGKPIIAMTSRTKSGASKIVAEIKAGAGVVTTRSHTHYVVTEFGVANLNGRTIGERAKLLVEIAHPSHREALERDFWATHKSL